MEDSHRKSDDPIETLSSEAWDADEDEGEGLDPRVQDELEALNSAAESINRLENEVQKAKTKFRLMKAESTQRLYALSKKIGRKWIVKARPYFDLLAQSHKGQQEAQKATIKFQKANSFYKAAKETVTLAEQQVVTEDGATVSFDSAWQEMLNHATMKFMEAEKEKAACESEHEQKAKEYATIQQKLCFLLKEIPRAISRAKVFFELKDTLQCRLQAERQNAEDLQLALICSKQKYRMALNSLENISEEVHRSRRLQLQFPLWRTPGVGAESDACSEMSDMPSINLDFMSETASQVSLDDFAEDGTWSPQIDVDLTLEEDMQESETPPIGKDVTRKMSDSAAQNSLGQIWARLGNGLTRITQDIGKASTNEKLEEPQSSIVANHQGMVRDDTVDGAEDQCTLEQVSQGAKKPGVRPKKMVRSLSCERLVVQQMSVVNLGAIDAAESSSKVSGKPPIHSSPRRMSVSALKSGVYVAQTLTLPGKTEVPKASASTKPVSDASTQQQQQQQFPILLDLKSTNQKSSPAYKPVSFIQNLQTFGKVPSKIPADGSDKKAVNQSVLTKAENLKKNSNADLTRSNAEEIFV